MAGKIGPEDQVSSERLESAALQTEIDNTLDLDIPCVYNMRMARVNVYLPDELADAAKRAGLNISGLTQDAIRSSVAKQDLALWQQRVAELDSPGVSHDKVADAVNSAKNEFEGA
jgi:post-segregation antitoxin (ccd killing protein)